MLDFKTSLQAEASFPLYSGVRKRDLCPGSKRTLIQPPSVVVDDAYKTHAPCIVC